MWYKIKATEFFIIELLFGTFLRWDRKDVYWEEVFLTGVTIRIYEAQNIIQPSKTTSAVVI